MKELQSCKNKNIPILILGPCLSHYNSNEEEVHSINNTNYDLPSINNYISNVEIGFASK